MTTSTPTADSGTRAARSVVRLPLGILFLVFALLMFANIDPVLAWKDEIEPLGQGRLFLYFTTQANLLAAAAFAVHGVALVRGRLPGIAAEYLRGFATVGMAITGIVHGLLLAEPGAPWNYSEFVLHQGGPVVLVLWWIVLPPRMPLPFTAILVWLAHPIAWTVTTLTYAAESPDHWVPYFFLDPEQMDGWAGVVLIIVVLHVVIAVLGLLAVLATRARWRDGMWRRLGLETAG